MFGAEAELDQLKRVDLPVFAVRELGFEPVKEKSSKISACLESPDLGRIIVSRAANGHFVFFAVAHPDRHGSILDLVMWARACSLGQARQIIRPWLGNQTPPPLSMPVPAANHGAAASTAPTGQPLRPRQRDTDAVRARWATFGPLHPAHPYLIERGIRPEVLAEARFGRSLRADTRGNVAFAYHSEAGICGVEVRGPTSKRFLAGSIRGLWGAKSDDDTRLIVFEGPIDALAWASLHGWDKTRFIATGGAMSALQQRLLAAAIARLPTGAAVTIATDADPAGDRMGEQLRGVFTRVGRPDLSIGESRPPERGTDWADVARAAARPTP